MGGEGAREFGSRGDVPLGPCLSLGSVPLTVQKQAHKKPTVFHGGKLL